MLRSRLANFIHLGMVTTSNSQSKQEQGQRHAQPHLWLVYIALQIILLLCYLPVLHSSYAFADDYYYLARSLRASDWLSAVMREALLQGRPFDGLAIDLSFSCLHNVADLVYLRLIGIAGATCVAFCSYHLLVKAGWQKFQSFCLSLCFVTVPAFQVFLSWSVAASHVLPAIAAYIAILCADISTRQNRPANLSSLSAAIVAMFFAVGFYQPSAMLFWLFAAILLFSNNDKAAVGNRQPKLLITLLAVFAAASALEIGIFEWAKHYFGTASVLPQRSHFTTHFATKINWFIHGPLVDALNFSRLQPSGRLAICLLSLITLGLFFYFKGNSLKRLLQVASAASLIPLSFLPNLAISENFCTYRTQAAITPLLIFYAFLAVHGFMSLVSKSLSTRIITGLTVLAAVLSLGLASYNVSTFFVVPQTLELRLIQSQLNGDLGEKRKMSPVLLKRDDTLAPFARYDEFGLPSLCQPWVPEPFIFLLKQKLVESPPSH